MKPIIRPISQKEQKNFLPAESPEIATRFGSIFSLCALFALRMYFVTVTQSSSPAGKGCSGARRYLSKKNQFYSNQSQLQLTQQK